MAYHDPHDASHVPYTSASERAYYDRGRSPPYDIPANSWTSSNASDPPRGISPEWGSRSIDSNLPPPNQPIQQPLKNAIGNAFEKSDAARIVHPDLIAQITAEVKKSVLDEIKLSGIAGATQPISGTHQQYVPTSPASTSASIPPRDVYTPPSPKHADFPIQASPARDPFSRDLDGADDTPKPRYERSAPIDIPQDRLPVRPAPAARMATDDYTPIEKMWQRLFDADGQPLPRLGEFLRGLALHLVGLSVAPKYDFANAKCRSKTTSRRRAW